MVGGRLGMAGAQAASCTITASYFSPWLSASLEDFLSPKSLWLSSLQHSGTSCLVHLPSTPCDELMRFMLFVGLDLIFVTSYAKRGTRSDFPGNIDCSSSVFWPIVYLSSSNQSAIQSHCQCKSAHSLLLAEMAKLPLSLLFMMAFL